MLLLIITWLSGIFDFDWLVMAFWGQIFWKWPLVCIFDHSLSVFLHTVAYIQSHRCKIISIRMILGTFASCWHPDFVILTSWYIIFYEININKHPVHYKANAVKMHDRFVWFIIRHFGNTELHWRQQFHPNSPHWEVHLQMFPQVWTVACVQRHSGMQPPRAIL